MTKNIFISANDGKVEVNVGPGNTVGIAATPEELSKIIDDNNISGDCYFSSSMDFADEYGFKTWDGARKIWDQMNELRSA